MGPAHQMLSSVEGVVRHRETTYDPNFGYVTHEEIYQPKNSLYVEAVGIKIKGHQKVRKITKGNRRTKSFKKYSWNSK